MGWFALVVGLSGLTAGIAGLIGAGDKGISTGIGCRALCGLALLIEEMLGAPAGHYVLSAMLFVLGIVGTWLGVRLLRNR